MQGDLIKIKNINFWNLFHFLFHCKKYHTGEATGGVLLKKLFLEISQNSQEITCTRVCFFLKSCRPRPATSLKKETLVQVFSCEFREISKTTFSTKHHLLLLTLILPNLQLQKFYENAQFHRPKLCGKCAFQQKFARREIWWSDDILCCVCLLHSVKIYLVLEAGVPWKMLSCINFQDIYHAGVFVFQSIKKSRSECLFWSTNSLQKLKCRNFT